jgi:hypothetical protein
MVQKRHILVINVKRRLLFIHLISKSGDPGFPENSVLLYEAFDTETTTSFDTQTAKLFVEKNLSRIKYVWPYSYSG